MTAVSPLREAAFEVEESPRPTGALVAPMSHAQERLWLVDAAAPGDPTYNVPLLTRWRRPLDPDALASALTAVVARHDVLRTRYLLGDDGPVQVVDDPFPVAVEVRTTSSALEAEISDRATRPFDLAAGPVLRCTAWPEAPGGALVLIVVHHIAIDGWSLAVFYGDLADAYLSALRGEQPTLPAPSLRYVDFALWDRATAAGARRSVQLNARVAALAALLDVDPELLLVGARPVDRVRPVRPGAQRTYPLPARLWTDVARTAQTLRATPFVVLNAAFQAALYRLSGRREFLIGAVTASRPHPDVEPLVGFFVNTVPMRCRVEPGGTLRELCAAVRAEAYGMLTHQWIPYDQLTAGVAAARDGGHHALVNVCFAMQNMPPSRVPEELWSPATVLPTGTAKFDLLLIVEGTVDGGVVTIEYDTDRYDAPICDRFAHAFLKVLHTVVADPDARLDPAAPGPRPSVLPTPSAGPTPPAQPSRAVTDAALVDEEQRRWAVEFFRDALGDLVAGRPVAAESNFFGLGGHSLLAVTMLAQANRRHGIRLSPREFLAEPTVSGLARLLTAGLGAAAASGAATVGPPAAPGTSAELNRAASKAEAAWWPATSTQQRFWFLDRLAGLRAAYLMPTVLELAEEIDRTALARAIDLVLAHHPALRSRFVLDRRQRRVCLRTDGAPARSVIEPVGQWTPDRLAALCWTGFDLSRDPPARAHLLPYPDGRTVLVLVLHHVVADGRSLRLVLDQIAASYRAIRSGGSPALPPAGPVVPGRPDGGSGEDADVQTDRLVAWLAGAPVDVALPFDRPRGTTQSSLAAVACRTLPAELTARLRAVGADSACSMFAVAAALLAVSLARRTSQRDFVFAFPWGGFGGPHDLAVGLGVNTVPVRVDTRGVATWRDLLSRVRESAAVSLRNAEAGYDEIVARLHPERDLSRPPLTPVYLSLLDAGPLPDFAARAVPLDPLHIKYELEVTVVDHGDHLEFAAGYLVDLFDADTAEALVAELVAVSADLVTNSAADPIGPSPHPTT